MTTLGDRLREEAKLHEEKDKTLQKISEKRQYDTLVQYLMKEIPKGKRYITVPYFIDKNIYNRLTKDKLYVYYVTYDEVKNDCMYKIQYFH